MFTFFIIHRPFLEFKPISGSFQVNPPMCEELIDATLQHIDRLLTDSQEPLRYIETMPDPISSLIVALCIHFLFSLCPFPVLLYFCQNGKNRIYRACRASKKAISNANWWWCLVWRMNIVTVISTFYPSECNASN